LAIDWPGAQTNLDGDNPTPADGAAWFGSLITGQRDGSGMTYLRNRYYDPSSGRLTQEDPIGLAGGANLYGFSHGDPVNFADPLGLEELTLAEQKQLGDLCKRADCTKIQVHRGYDSRVTNGTRSSILKMSGRRSFTSGNDIWLANGADFAELGHEVTHSMQFQKWGSSEYLRQGFNERMFELEGGNPYGYRLNGRPFEKYGMEQQAQIVEDCFRGKRASCWASRVP
jgi:RHS repeat-associated protein